MSENPDKGFYHWRPPLIKSLELLGKYERSFEGRDRYDETRLNLAGFFALSEAYKENYHPLSPEDGEDSAHLVEYGDRRDSISCNEEGVFMSDLANSVRGSLVFLLSIHEELSDFMNSINIDNQCLEALIYEISSFLYEASPEKEKIEHVRSEQLTKKLLRESEKVVLLLGIPEITYEEHEDSYAVSIGGLEFEFGKSEESCFIADSSEYEEESSECSSYCDRGQRKRLVLRLQQKMQIRTGMWQDENMSHTFIPIVFFHEIVEKTLVEEERFASRLQHGRENRAHDIAVVFEKAYAKKYLSNEDYQAYLSFAKAYRAAKLKEAAEQRVVELEEAAAQRAAELREEEAAQRAVELREEEAAQRAVEVEGRKKELIQIRDEVFFTLGFERIGDCGASLSELVTGFIIDSSRISFLYGGIEKLQIQFELEIDTLHPQVAANFNNVLNGSVQGMGNRFEEKSLRQELYHTFYFTLKEMPHIPGILLLIQTAIEESSAMRNREIEEAEAKLREVEAQSRESEKQRGILEEMAERFQLRQVHDGLYIHNSLGNFITIRQSGSTPLELQLLFLPEAFSASIEEMVSDSSLEFSCISKENFDHYRLSFTDSDTELFIRIFEYIETAIGNNWQDFLEKINDLSLEPNADDEIRVNYKKEMFPYYEHSTGGTISVELSRDIVDGETVEIPTLSLIVSSDHNFVHREYSILRKFCDHCGFDVHSDGKLLILKIQLPWSWRNIPKNAASALEGLETILSYFENPHQIFHMFQDEYIHWEELSIIKEQTGYFSQRDMAKILNTSPTHAGQVLNELFFFGLLDKQTGRSGTRSNAVTFSVIEDQKNSFLQDPENTHLKVFPFNTKTPRYQHEYNLLPKEIPIDILQEFREGVEKYIAFLRSLDTNCTDDTYWQETVLLKCKELYGFLAEADDKGDESSQIELFVNHRKSNVVAGIDGFMDNFIEDIEEKDYSSALKWVNPILRYLPIWSDVFGAMTPFAREGMDASIDSVLPSEVLTEEFCEQMKEEAEHYNMKLVLSIDAQINTAYVTCIPAYLRILVENIMYNAWTHGDAQNISIQVTVSDDPSGIIVSISDDGRGVPEKHLPHIFRYGYSQTGKAKSGLGIGGAQSILSQFSGGIKCYPHGGTNEGARFDIFLSHSL